MFLEAFPILLRRRRRADRECLRFLQFLLVLLEHGYELNYAWSVAARELPEFSGLSHSTRQRVWWEGLEELRRSQSPLVPYLRAWTNQLSESLISEMEEHGRALPTRLNLVLILFNLPPLFILLFGPLLLSLHWLR